MLVPALLLFVALSALAQQPFSMVEIDEIGQLSTDFDQRWVADLGLARAYVEDFETLRVEGRDAKGLPWRVWIPKVRGFGATRVFSADFDANGQADLLFSALFPGNGRCVEGGTVTALLFDDDGRPVPWRAPTHGLTNDDSRPVVILDLDADGRAELVTTECQYSEFRDDERRLGEDRWISGVYEAREARWIPERPFSLDPYLNAAQSRFAGYRPGFIEWIPAPDEAWLDPLEGWEASAEVRLSGLLTWEIGCRGVLFRFVVPDPLFGEDCGEGAESNRVRLSDGRVLAVWPATVIDSTAGRDIDMADPRGALARIVGSGSLARLLGPSTAPEFLWARTETRTQSEVRARLAVSISRPMALKLTEELPIEERSVSTSAVRTSIASPFGLLIPTGEADSKDSAAAQGEPGFRFRGSASARVGALDALPRGTYFSRDGRCFFLPAAAAEERLFLSLPDCSKLGDLQSAAVQGERVWTERRDEARRVSSTENMLRIRHGRADRPFREIGFHPVAGHSGEVLGAVRFDPGWLVQWSLGGQSWLALHSDDGEPISPAISLDLEGELFDGGGSKGLAFLRWEDGVPVELTAVRAAIEWVRAE